MKQAAITPSLLIAAGITTLLTGCATSGRLSTFSGRPEIVIPKAYARNAHVAITSYNLNHGRELDQAHANRIVTYEGIKTSNGDPQVSSKIVYAFTPKNDSIVITSQRLITNDLDDDDASEDAAQPSLELQQLELQQIAKALMENAIANDDDKLSTPAIGAGESSQ